MMNDHDMILELLKKYATNDKARLFAHMIAKKAFGQRHLYEDLGFESRVLYNEHMTELYPELANEKPKNIRWKKFLFDKINSIAPACTKCDDQALCHGCDVKF